MPETATATAAASIPNSWKATHPDDEDDDDYVRFGEERDDFMMRFVDDTCQGIFPSGDGPCIGMLPGCEARLDHQMDLLTVRACVATTTSNLIISHTVAILTLSLVFVVVDIMI